MSKIAFVIPWFGVNISGGAESACRDLSKHLKQAGLDIEILTTCVKDFTSDWNVNYYNEGVEFINDIPVKRFKVKKRDTKLFDKINYELMNNIPINYEKEEIFFNEMINSPDLYKYIFDNKDNYQAFIFIPYMFGTTYYGIKACPEKSIIIPCLHDESYAYLSHIKEMFESVKGIIFLSEEEKKLADKLYKIQNIKKEVIGTGIDTNVFYNGKRFRKKYNIKNPYIIYAGRKDKGKNVDLLIKYYQRFITENKDFDLDLVLIGGGHIDIPFGMRNKILDLGFVSTQDKYDCLSEASLLCHPSLYESFSIIMMESWLCETPVLVNDKCEVTKKFCIMANGGLYFSNYYEFEECVKYILKNKQIAKKMARQGKYFVLKNFNWDIVTNKYINFINNIFN